MGSFQKTGSSRVWVLHLAGEFKSAAESLGEITGCDPVQVVLDALGVYEWVLAQQTAGHTVGTDQGQLQDFVVNRPAAKQYFSPPSSA